LRTTWEASEGAGHWAALGRELARDALWNRCVFEPIADPQLKPEVRSDRIDRIAVSHAVMPPMQITTYGARAPTPVYHVTRVNQASTLHVDGQEPIHLAPNELVISSSQMRGVWTTDKPYTSSTVHVDEDLFRQYFPAAAQLVGCRLSLPFQFGEILHQIMDASIAISGTDRFKTQARGLISSFLQILALPPEAGEAIPAIDSDARDARRHQIKSYLRRNFADPELSIEGAARHLGVSTRYMQIVFASDGMSPAAYLRRCRLEASSRMLVASEYSSASITRIALECGFGSSAHFSTEFRRYFGVSPRVFRNRH